MSSVLRIEQLSIGYNQSLVSEICVEVQIGDIAVVIGENGSGKSCLLKTLVGLIMPIAGDIYYNDFSIKSLTRVDLASRVSFALNLNPISSILVREFLSFSNLNNSLTDSQMAEIISNFKLEALLDKNLHSISDGQKQMVSIARCIVQNTPIIYLDEPTAFLDYLNVNKIIEIVKYYSSEGKTILINTHDRAWIEELENKKVYGIKNKKFVAYTNDVQWNDIKIS